MKMRILLSILGIVTLMALLVPLWIIVPMSFSPSRYLEFPPSGFSLRWYEAVLGDDRWRSAILGSLGVAAASSSIALVFGSFAAHGLARSRGFVADCIETLFIAPMLVPVVVSAVGTYIVLSWWRMNGTFAGLVLAHTVLVTPYVIIIMLLAFRAFDAKLEDAARSLGASEMQIYRQILLPNLLPSMVAAWLIAFLSSFDELVLSLLLAGSILMVPTELYSQLLLEVDPAITAVSSLLIAATAFCVVAAAWGMGRGGTRLAAIFGKRE